MKAAVYLRQSLDRDGQGLAVERQRQDCTALCEARGWVAVEYVDNSISASSGKARPAYARMLEDIAAGRIQGVVAWDLDRLHRRPIELEHFIDLADKHRLALATVTGDIDLSTDNGRLYARIKGSVARAEVERKSARQRRAGLQRAEAGKPWGPHRPFGFEDDKTTHRPEEAAAIRALYADLLAGISQHEMARNLNARGIKTTKGGEWVQSTVRELLRSPRNAGLRHYKGEIMGKGDWEPIVSEETWRVALQRTTTTAGGGGPRKYLLSGIAKCGVCGLNMVTAYLPGKVRTYACTSGKHVARKAETVDQQVSETILTVLESAPLPSLTADKNAPKYSELSKQADTLRHRLDSLAIEFADGELTASQLRAATDRLQSKIAEIEQTMTKRSTSAALAPLAGSEDLRKTWEGLSVARRRAIIDALAVVTMHPVKNRRNPEPESVEIAPRLD